nr:hypothetical protein [Tanacetum cinerariifolium]
MSSDNAQSAVIYTSIFSNSDGPSWGILLMNASEFLEIDPCEEVAQQGQAHPLSPTYVLNPIELDESVLVHVLEPEHPEYHAPSDDDVQFEDDDEDPKKDPNEEHEPEDDDEDLNEEHDPKDEDTREPSKDSYETKPFEEDETAVTPPPIHQSSTVAAARAPRSQYDFVDTVEVGHGLIRSPGHDSQTIARVADKVEDVGYVRALQASERRMMTSIEEVSLRVNYHAQVRRQESKYFYTELYDAQTNRKDIRLEIDVMRGQRTAYKTELQEVHQAYLSSEARNRVLLARLETLETHMSRMEWQRQSTEDLAVIQMMRIHTLEARARTDTVEDANSSC